MSNRKHLYLMIGLGVVAGVLMFTGRIGGGLFTLAWVAGCVVMMSLMMFFMMRGMGGGGRRTDGVEKPKDAAGHGH